MLYDSHRKEGVQHSPYHVGALTTLLGEGMVDKSPPYILIARAHHRVKLTSRASRDRDTGLLCDSLSAQLP
jgi:hypothetical protein